MVYLGGRPIVNSSPNQYTVVF